MELKLLERLELLKRLELLERLEQLRTGWTHWSVATRNTLDTLSNVWYVATRRCSVWNDLNA